MGTEIEVIARNGNTAALTPQSNGITAIIPTNLTEAIQLAELMSKASLVPKHLQGNAANCFLVVEQSMRWGLSPFAVAQCTSVINGRLMYEGKLVAAVINASGTLARNLDYQYIGQQGDRSVTVFGQIRGEAKTRDVVVPIRSVQTESSFWKTQPDQQLAYSGARVWARRHMPELMLGVNSPEEMELDAAPDVPLSPPDPPEETEAEQIARWTDALTDCRGDYNKIQALAARATKEIQSPAVRKTFEGMYRAAKAEAPKPPESPKKKEREPGEEG